MIAVEKEKNNNWKKKKKEIPGPNPIMERAELFELRISVYFTNFSILPEAESPAGNVWSLTLM